MSLCVLAHHRGGSATTCTNDTSNNTTLIEVFGYWICGPKGLTMRRQAESDRRPVRHRFTQRSRERKKPWQILRSTRASTWWRGQDLHLRPSGYESGGSRLRASVPRRIRPGRRISSRRARALLSTFVWARWCWSCSHPVRAFELRLHPGEALEERCPHTGSTRRAQRQRRGGAQPVGPRAECDHVDASRCARRATKAVGVEAMAVAGPKAQRSTPLDDDRLPTVLSAR